MLLLSLISNAAASSSSTSSATVPGGKRTSIWFYLVVTLLWSTTISGGSSLCRSDQFQCSSGDCIRLTRRCDGEVDCPEDNSDENGCDRNLEDEFLLLSVFPRDNNTAANPPRIYQIDVASSGAGRSTPLPGAFARTPASLAIDPLRMVLYYVDKSAELIASLPLNQTGANFRIVYTAPNPERSSLDGLALAPRSQNLYYSDAGQNNSEIVEIQLTSGQRRVIESGRNTKPKALVLDETNSELYWTDWGSPPGIYVIGLEPGARKRTLIADGIVIPNALAIDFTVEVMYWVDAHIDRIEMSSLNGTNRRVLLTEANAHYYAMTISRQFLFIADWARGHIRKFNRQTNVMSDQNPNFGGLKTGIVFYSSNFTNVARRRNVSADFTSSVKPEGTSVTRMTLTPSKNDSEGWKKTEELAAGKDSFAGTTFFVVAGVVGTLLVVGFLLLTVWLGCRKRSRRLSDDPGAVSYTTMPQNTLIATNSYEYLPSDPRKSSRNSTCEGYYSTLNDDLQRSKEGAGDDSNYYDDTGKFYCDYDETA